MLAERVQVLVGKVKGKMAILIDDVNIPYESIYFPR